MNTKEAMEAKAKFASLEMDAGMPTLARNFSSASLDSDDFYQAQYNRMCTLNHELTRGMDQVQRENKQLVKTLGQYQHHLNVCMRRLESLGSPYHFLNVRRPSFEPSDQTSHGDMRTIREAETTSSEPCFQRKCDLKGHTGSVYTVQFSPNGKWLASGSLDKTVRVWDLKNTSETRCLKQHNLNVSSLSWSPNSKFLLSGSYDSTVSLWAMETGQAFQQFTSPGLVQSVAWSPDPDSSIFFAACSKPVIVLFDRRAGPKPCGELMNDSMVNSIYAYNCASGSCVISGDNKGGIKAWSLQTGKPVATWECGSGQRPVSHVCGVRGTGLVGANCYDNILRVFALPTKVKGSKPKLLNTLEGHKNMNWPIKSSMFRGPVLANLEETAKSDRAIDRTLIATGSADKCAYIFDITDDKMKSERLAGHKGRVYGVDFHPKRPTVASCSADGVIKLWEPKIADVTSDKI